MNNSIICRYCLESNAESDKIFIAPCLCTGSIRYVHKECFLTFLNQKLETYGWSDEIKCELCNYELNLIFSITTFNASIFIYNFFLLHYSAIFRFDWSDVFVWFNV